MQTNFTPNKSQTSNKKFFKTSDGVTNGVIIGNSFRRDVIPSKHFVWRHHAYALDACEAERLNAVGVRWIVFIEKPAGIEYSVSMDDFLSNGIRDQLGKCELQIFMPVSQMSVTKPMHIQSKALKAGEVKYKRGKKTMKQLSLFDRINRKRGRHE